MEDTTASEWKTFVIYLTWTVTEKYLYGPAFNFKIKQKILEIFEKHLQIWKWLFLFYFSFFWFKQWQAWLCIFVRAPFVTF